MYLEKGDLEAVRGHEEQALLARAGQLLRTSLDVGSTVAAMAGLLVGRLGDYCIAEAVGADGELERVEVASHPPGSPELAQRLRDVELDRNRPHLSSPVLASGALFVNNAVDAAFLAEIAQHELHRKLLEETGLRAVLAMPLRARDRLRGCLILFSSRRQYDARDQWLVSEVAERAALALDNAHLYQEARQATRQRDELLATIAHDLRNPLNAIRLAADAVLLDPAESREKTRRALRSIIGTVDRASALVGDLVDSAGADHGQLRVLPRPEDPAELAVEAVTFARELARQHLVVAEIEPKLPPVDADRRRVAQVFSNLIGNAIKFTPLGGRITLGAQRAGPFVEFFVTDSGSGIDPAVQKRIFDRYWQAEPGDGRGVGLGLSIVKAIIDAHGGVVTVRSELGRGTTLSFALPVSSELGAEHRWR